MKLYSYAFSNAPVRARIVLYLKGIPFDRIEVDLLQCKDSNGDSFFEINPQGMVPTLVDGDLILTQSVAIAEYLDEVFPTPRLMPTNPKGRARVRSLALMIACDGQPLVNLRVRRFLTRNLHFSNAAMLSWVRHWLASSLREYEAMLKKSLFTGSFSHGDAPTLADAFLVPQVLLARRFGVNLTPYTLVLKVHDQCMSLAPFQRATSEYLIEDPAFGLDFAK